MGTMTERDKYVAKTAVDEAAKLIRERDAEIARLKQQNETLRARAAALSARLREQGED